MSHFKSLLRQDEIHHQQLKKLTGPLKTRLGIDSFAYSHIGADGSFVNLCNFPELSAFHFNTDDCFRNMECLCSPEQMTPGMLLLSYDEGYKKVLAATSGKKPLFYPMTIVRKDERGNSELFWFATQTDNARINHCYINNKKLLMRFTDYFREETKALRASLNSQAVSLPEILGEKEFHRNHIGGDGVSQEQKRAFLQDLGVDPMILVGAKRLSAREKELLRSLLEGETALRAAARFGLSRRTVEYYLENCKNKLGALCKQELRRMANILDTAGCLN